MKNLIVLTAMCLSVFGFAAFADERIMPLQIVSSSGCSSGLAGKAEDWSYFYCVVDQTQYGFGPGYYQACINFVGAGRGDGTVYVTTASPAANRVYLGCE